MNGSIESIGRHIAEIHAPEFNFAVVRGKVAEERTPPRRRLSTIVAVALLVAAPLLVAAAAHFIPLRVTHRFGNWQLYGPDRGVTVMNPTMAAFDKAAREAPYAVIWPLGLPSGDKPFMLGTVGSEVFIITYSCVGRDIARASSLAVIVPKNYSAINTKLGKWFTSQLQDHPNNALWDVGDESILFGSDCLTPAQIARVRAATGSRGR